jgi:hypothetical protein
MIQPADLLEQLHVQLQDLISMLVDEDILSGKIQLPIDKPSAEEAVPFCESLILCLTKGAATALVK